MAKTVVYKGKKFVLQFDPKVHRAIYGNERGGGVGEDATELQLLAEYDRLGGFITLGGRKVANGTFYDARKKRAVEEPDVKFAAKPKAVEKVEEVGDKDESEEDEDTDEEESEEQEEESEESDSEDESEDEKEAPQPVKKGSKKRK
jgi:hypothetical protein